MSFAAGSIWEVQTGGDDTNNGGGFDPGSASFATDLVGSNATGTSAGVTSASYSFISRDVGHWLFIKAGTNWTPGWYKITGVILGAATVDCAAGHCPQYRSGTGGGTPDKISTIDGCATTAAPTGGTWSIDYSQGTGIAFTDLVQASTTTMTSAAKPMGTNFVGNVLSLVSGTGTWTTQRVQITSVTGTTATVDKTLGGSGGTGGTGSIGGPLASPGLAGGLAVASNGMFAKSGTYTISTASTNVSGGCVALSVSGSASAPLRVEGYGTYRCDKGTRPVFSCGAVSAATLFAFSGAITVLDNWSLNGNGQTTSRGYESSSSRNLAIRCHGASFTNSAFSVGGNCDIQRCTATGCSTQPAFVIASAQALACEAYANTVTGFSFSSNAGLALFCLSSVNTGSSSVHGFSLGGGVANHVMGCVAYGNAGDGFNYGAGVVSTTINCIAEGNTGTGFNTTAADVGSPFTNNAYYNNGTNVSTNFQANHDGILATASMFVNAASGDFSLNNTSGAGADVRSAGYPGLHPRGLTRGYLDIGAAQHQGSGGAAINTPVLAVTDAEDGTGGTATVSGATSGTTNTLYVGSWAGGVGGVTFASEGSRVGSGTITMTLTPGYYWGYVESTDSILSEVSNLIYFRITDSDDEVSISYQYQLAVQARIQSLALVGISNDNIAVKKLPWHRATDTYPQIILTGYLPESFQRGAGTNQRNDVGYPVTVTILEADNQNLTANHERNLLWRQRIVQACIDRQIEPSLGTGNSQGICTVEPNTVVIPESFANNVFHSSFVLRFTTRQVRGI